MKKLFGIFLALISVASFGATTVPVQLLNPTGSSSGQTIVSTGSSSAPGWSTLGLSGLSAISANTLVGNATGSSAAPTAVTVTGCNGAGQALQWTNGSGFGCNSSVATSGANTNITSLTAGTTLNTPTITGATGGTCASAGNVGECKQSSIPIGSAVSLTTGTATTITSVSLTAGNWLCTGNAIFYPAGATVTSAEAAWISSTAPPSIPTTPNSGSYISLSSLPNTAGGNGNALPVGQYPINVTTTTTVYLVSYAVFTTNVMTAYGAINCFRWH